MREAVHIFLKDSRQLRYAIAIVLGWTAIFVVAAAAPLQPYQRVEGWFSVFGLLVPTVSTYVLPVAWWYLICQAFHAEALPGDRQFWLTRPYHRASLFGAKALFVLAYITLPLALAQAAVIVLKGFPLGPHLLGILWAQLLILAGVILPAAAVATLTSTLAQFVTVGLAAPLLLVAKNLLTPWLALEWIRDAVAICIIVAVTAVVLFLQFSRRRTQVSRILALGGILMLVAILPLLSWRTAFAFHLHSDRRLEGNVTAELMRPQQPSPRSQATWPIRLSFRVLGPATGTPIACEAAEVNFESPEGVWRTGLEGIGRVETMSTIPDGCAVEIPGVLVRAVADRQVDLHAILYITVFGIEQAKRVPIDEPPTFVPNAGLCRGTLIRPLNLTADTADNSLTVVGCLTALRGPRGQVVFSLANSPTLRTSGRFSYSPFPADLKIQPVDEGGVANFRRVDAVMVAAQTPIAHVRSTVDVRDVHLRDLR